MTLRKSILILALTMITGTSLAHQGVKNPAVKARMDSMSAIKAEMKLISDMAKGLVAFEVTTAREAASEVARHGRKTPDLFRDRQDDPVSEALPSIWETYSDFVEKSTDMEKAASKAARDINDLTSLRASLADIGRTCKACHSDYRK